MNITFLIRRFFASYIDALIVSVFVVLFSIFKYKFAGKSGLNEIELSADFWLKWQLIGYFIYLFLFEFFFKRTLGKMLFRFKIQGFGNKINLGHFLQVLKRTLSRIIPLDPISIFFDEDWIMWHDKLSKTKVIDIRKK